MFLSISFINGQDHQISFSYNKISLKEAIQQLINNYQLPIIYPSKIEEKLISKECDNCDLDSALTLLFYNTDYHWKKIDAQYTIYKISSNLYSLGGRIIDITSNETIPYANVFIPSLNIGTISNDEGIFFLPKIKSRLCTLYVSYIGYETKQQPVYFSNNEKVDTDIYLKQKIIKSKNIFIRGKSREFMQLSQEPSKISFSPKHISTLPTIGEVDISRSLQLLPGIHQGLGGTAELYIRGGRPDQNLIIVDGMPIYQRTHMFGFLSSIQSKAVKDIQVYKGVYPAIYGGRTSGLIQITNRIGNTIKPHARFYSNFTINSAQIELPISTKSSLIFTARHGNKIVSTKLYTSIKNFITVDDNFNLLSMSAIEDQTSNYNPMFTFKDISTVFSYLINPKNRISITYTTGSDLINEKREFYGFNSILVFDSTRIQEETEWSNQGAIFNWSFYLNPKWRTKLYILKTGYNSLHNSNLFISNNANNIPQQSTNEKNIFTDQTYGFYQSVKNFTNHHLEIGLNRSSLSANYKTKRSLVDSSENISLAQNAYLQSIYIQDSWSISKLFNINIGFRNTYYSDNKENYFTPRLSGSFILTPSITIETGIGQNNQFTHQFNSNMSTRGTQGSWLISSGDVPIISSDNSHSSIYWKNPNYDFSLSYYQKNSSGHYDFGRFISPIAILSNQNNNENRLQNDMIGNEKTIGSEIFIRRKNRQINGWIAYQFNNTDYSFNDSHYYSANHDITHEFKSVMMTSILDYDFTATWSYSSGRVYTHLDEINITNDFQIFYNDGKRNKERLEPVHHLDISISKSYTLNYLQLNVGLSIYNIYNKKNISHKRYNPYSSENIISNVVMLGFTPTFFIEASL